MIIVSSLFTEVDRKPYIQSHFDFLKEKTAKNLIMAAGRKRGGEGGLMLWNSDDPEFVRQQMQEEPLYANGALTFELIDFDTDFVSEAFRAARQAETIG